MNREQKSALKVDAGAKVLLVLVLTLVSGLVLGGCAAGADAGGDASGDTITVSLLVDGTEAGKGIIFDDKVQIPANSSVYDLLLASGLDMKARQSTTYVESLGGLAEKEQVMTSGWIYRVNGVKAGVLAGGYTLEDGDEVSWTWYLDALAVTE